MLNALVRMSCHCRSWFYEFLAVIGISLATNILAACLTSVVTTKLAPWNIPVWLAGGFCALIYAQEFREHETTWHQLDDADPDADDVTQWTWGEVSQKRLSKAVFFVMVLLLLAGIALGAATVVSANSVTPAPTSGPATGR